MNPSDTADPYHPDLRARNVKLGLLVGAFALGVMALAFGRFVFWGLPEDRATYEQQQQRKSAESAPDAAAKDAVDE